MNVKCLKLSFEMLQTAYNKDSQLHVDERTINFKADISTQRYIFVTFRRGKKKGNREIQTPNTFFLVPCPHACSSGKLQKEGIVLD